MLVAESDIVGKLCCKTPTLEGCQLLEISKIDQTDLRDSYLIDKKYNRHLQVVVCSQYKDRTVKVSPVQFSVVK